MADSLVGFLPVDEDIMVRMWVKRTDRGSVMSLIILYVCLPGGVEIC